jgi:hypothetical protein
MRRALALASLVIAIGTVGGPVASASTSYDPFRGSWTSKDSGDGSDQTLSIQGSGAAGRHSVFLHDTVATRACGGGPANVTGSGTVDGATLTWFFTVTCPAGGRPPIIGRVGPGFFTYNPTSGTLTDDTGTIWYPAG